MEIHRTPRKADLSTDRRNAETTLAVAEAVALAASDPHAVLDIVLRCADQAEATRALQERFRIEQAPARAILDMQFHRVTRTDRARIAAWVREARAFLDSEPDPEAPAEG